MASPLALLGVGRRAGLPAAGGAWHSPPPPPSAHFVLSPAATWAPRWRGGAWRARRGARGARGARGGALMLALTPESTTGQSKSQGSLQRHGGRLSLAPYGCGNQRGGCLHSSMFRGRAACRWRLCQTRCGCCTPCWTRQPPRTSEHPYGARPHPPAMPLKRVAGCGLRVCQYPKPLKSVLALAVARRVFFLGVEHCSCPALSLLNLSAGDVHWCTAATCWRYCRPLLELLPPHAGGTGTPCWRGMPASPGMWGSAGPGVTLSGRRTCPGQGSSSKPQFGQSFICGKERMSHAPTRPPPSSAESRRLESAELGDIGEVTPPTLPPTTGTHLGSVPEQHAVGGAAGGPFVSNRGAEQKPAWPETATGMGGGVGAAATEGPAPSAQLAPRTPDFRGGAGLLPPPALGAMEGLPPTEAAAAEGPAALPSTPEVGAPTEFGMPPAPILVRAWGYCLWYCLWYCIWYHLPTPGGRCCCACGRPSSTVQHSPLPSGVLFASPSARPSKEFLPCPALPCPAQTCPVQHKGCGSPAPPHDMGTMHAVVSAIGGHGIPYHPPSFFPSLFFLFLFFPSLRRVNV